MLRTPLIEVLAAIGMGVVAVGFGVGMHLWFESVGLGSRPVPWLDRAPWVAAGVLLVSLPVTWWRMWARRADRAACSRGVRIWIGLLLVAQFFGVLGGLAGVLVSDPDFLFGKGYRSSLSGDRGETYYLYSGGLFCDYTIYLAEPGSLWAKEHKSMSRKSCKEDVHMRKTELGVIMVDATGTPLGSNADWGAALYWGPH